MKMININKSIFLKILFSIGVFLVCLVVLEFTLKIISPSIFHSDLKLIPNQKMRINVELDGVSPVIYHSTNKWGFRGDEIPDNPDDYYFILAIGGSTTQCFYLDDKNTWPHLLQGFLKQSLGKEEIIVQNAGIDGHSSRGHILMMKYVVPKVKPDMIVFLMGINDLGLSLDSKTYFEGNPFEKTPSFYKLFTKSRLFQIAYSWKRVLSGEATLSKAAHQNLVLRELIKPESELSFGYEQELISLSEYKENLKEIVKAGEASGIKMLFLTQPSLFEDTDYWSSIEGKTAWIKDERFYISARTYAKMLNKFNDKTLEVCQEEGVDCLDLANKIPHSQEYFYDAFHFNERGSQLVAKEINKYIMPIYE